MASPTPAPPAASPGPDSKRPRGAEGRPAGRVRRLLRALVRGVARFLALVFGPARRRLAVVRDAGADRRTRVRAGLAGAAWGSAGLGVVGLVVLVLWTLVLIPLTPSRASLRHARELHASVALSADGVELARFTRSSRTWVELDEVAPIMVSALLATEDRRFYEHGGIDLRRTAGAALYTLAGDRQGGSSLTQQLARNLYPREIGRSVSVVRKLKEAVTAVKIETVYDKDAILEIYLNTVPFLYNAVGVEMGAQTYFGKPAADLDTLEAAVLVGMLKGTSYYNPVRNPERALVRRNVVLRALVDQGHLTEARYARLREVPLRLRFERQALYSSRAPHFTEHVRAEVERWADANGYNLYGDGLVVHTTLNWAMQQAAAETARRFGDALQAVADVEWGRASTRRLGTTTTPYVEARRSTEPFAHFWSSQRETVDAFVRESEPYRRAVAAGQPPGAALDSLRADAAFMRALRETKTRLELGFVALDPRTGEVRAWVGSRDHARGPFDHVARARRQPGSTFKPFVYARALEEGFRPDDVLPNEPVEIRLAGDRVWRPRNADGEAVAGAEVTLREGLARSVNTAAAQLIEAVGPRDVARTARRMGVESPLEPVPSLALGTSETTLLEMASAYATIADAGTHRPPVVVTRIEDREGRVLAAFTPAPRRALDAGVSLTLLDMMRGVIDGGTGSGIRSVFGLQGDLAGKTGTTQNGADGWFLLMHPHLVAGAWVGFDDPRVTFRSAYWEQGGHNALRVVGDVARTLRRQGLLSRSAAFPPPPEPDPTFFDRLGEGFADWLDGVLSRPEPIEDAPIESDVDDLPPDAWDPSWEESWEDEQREAEREAERERAILEEERRRAEEAARELPSDLERATREAARRAADEAQREADRLLLEALREADPKLRDALREAAREVGDAARRQAEGADPPGRGSDPPGRGGGREGGGRDGRGDVPPGGW